MSVVVPRFGSPFGGLVGGVAPVSRRPSFDFPPNALGRWNPFEAGNTVTPGVIYPVMKDQAGDPAAMQDALMVGTPLVATDAEYPSRDLGLCAIPFGNSRFLRWDPGSPGFSLWNFTTVSWVPLTSIQNDQRFWSLRTGSGTRAISLRYETTGDPSFYVNMGITNIWADVTSNIGVPPNLRLGYSVDSYCAAALTCSIDGLTEGSTATWSAIIVCDLDDGAGCRLIGNASFDETVSTTAPNFAARDTCRGIESSNMTATGGMSLWRTALSRSEQIQAIIAGLATINPAKASQARAVLSGI